MIETYYGKDKHQYMRYENERFGKFIYSQITDSSFLNYDTAIELGAGMGRFSEPLAIHFSKVIIVEPVRAYNEILKDKFKKYVNIEILDTSAEACLAQWCAEKPVLIFAFHLLHHLDLSQRKEIYRFLQKTGSMGVFVEPNPYNPMILLQIIFHPDMRIREEIRYLRYTRRKYEKEFTENRLVLTAFKRFCFFPPFLTDLLLKRLPLRIVKSFERLNILFPFLSSYQMISCVRNAHEE